MTQRHHYRIADHHICIAFAPDGRNGLDLMPSFQPFSIDAPDATRGDVSPTAPTANAESAIADDALTADAEPLFTLTIDDTTRPMPREQRHRIRVFDTGNGDTSVDRAPDGSYQFIIKDIEGRDCCLLLADSTFAHCRCALNGTYPMRHFGLNNALMLCFAFAGAMHDTLLLHASLVRKDGYGYAFTAKSGTGKSTQVSMWLRFIPGCDLMNDDNPVIRIIDGTPYIYGTPWSGKTPCYRNTRARLGAITRIDRDTTNFVLPLQPIEAFATILSGASSMKWDERIHHALCDVVQKLVETTPIFSLHCLPNREAAEVCCEAIEVREEVKGKKEEVKGKKEEVKGNCEEGKDERKEVKGGGEMKGGKVKESFAHAVARRALDGIGWVVRLFVPHRKAAVGGGAPTMRLHNEVLLPEVVRLLDGGHTVTLPLRGISMRPFLEDGRDKALLVKATHPKVGDAVLAEISPKTYVLHRLWRIDGEAATLLGDGNLTPEHCRLADIKGVATAFYRKGRAKPDPTDGRKWRAYSWLWTHLRPLRRPLLAIHRRVII